MKLVVDKASLVSVADAIRSKGGTTEELEFPQGFVSAVNAIESGGGGAEDYYKNIIQEALYKYEGSSNYHRISVFAGTSIEDVSMFDFSKVKVFSYAFWGSNIKELELDLSNASGDLSYLCSDCLNLTKVILKNMSSAYTAGTRMFGGSSTLETVETLDFSGFKTFGSNANYQPFYNCTSLKEIGIVENCIKSSISFVWSADLSDNSIEIILKALAPVETQQILTVHQTVYNKMLDNEYLSDLFIQAMDKGWDISY